MFVDSSGALVHCSGQSGNNWGNRGNINMQLQLLWPSDCQMTPILDCFYTAALVINTNLDEMGHKAHAPRVYPRVLVSSCPLSAVCRDINCGAAGVRR